MAVEVVVPSFGLGWSAGRVVEWCRADGAAVQRGDPVVLLESDHAIVELEAESDGVLRHRPGQDPGSVPPGEVLALILAPGERLPAEEPVLQVPAFPEAEAEPSPEWVPEDAEAQPVAILPLRRHTLPEAEGVVDDDSPWARIPGDDVEVGDEWIAEDGEPAGAEPAAAWDDPAPYGDLGAAAATPAPVTLLYDPPAAAEPAWEERFAGRFGEPEPPFEPPLKHVDEDPRDYFDVAPYAEGITVMEPDRDDDAAPIEAAPAAEPVADVAPEPAALLAAAAPALFLRVGVDMRESRKMGSQLSREWQGAGPADEDVVLRALGRALEELRLEVPGTSVAVVVPAREGDLRQVVAEAARRSFREAVAERAGGWSGEEPVATVVSFAAAGIEDGLPAIPAGHPFALGLGAARTWAVFEGDRVVPVPVASLILAYDPQLFPSGEAAWLIGRVRELLEAPYALLAA